MRVMHFAEVVEAAGLHEGQTVTLEVSTAQQWKAVCTKAYLACRSELMHSRHIFSLQSASWMTDAHSGKAPLL